MTTVKIRVGISGDYEFATIPKFTLPFIIWWYTKIHREQVNVLSETEYS